MNKFHIALFVIILIVFFGIIVTTEEGSIGHKASAVPTLPPDASTFQLITPTGPSHLQGQVQGAQSQQQQTQQQQQQQQEAQQQYQQAASVIQGPLNASVSATIKTSEGDIDVTLYGDQTPNSVRNFILKADTNYY